MRSLVRFVLFQDLFQDASRVSGRAASFAELAGELRFRRRLRLPDIHFQAKIARTKLPSHCRVDIKFFKFTLNKTWQTNKFFLLFYFNILPEQIVKNFRLTWQPPSRVRNSHRFLSSRKHVCGSGVLAFGSGNLSVRENSLFSHAVPVPGNDIFRMKRLSNRATKKSRPIKNYSPFCGADLTAKLHKKFFFASQFDDRNFHYGPIVAVLEPPSITSESQSGVWTDGGSFLLPRSDPCKTAFGGTSSERQSIPSTILGSHPRIAHATEIVTSGRKIAPCHENKLAICGRCRSSSGSNSMARLS